ncbi:MAG: antA/AntB antirepressor family protein [Turicibacter sp.]|nr:antA/AntB antirepressor family protein [Turicibacter sp.]
MEELVKISRGIQGNQLVSGRELHTYLESAERFSKWWDRMAGYGFEEGVDFTSVQKSTLVNN